jgi:hypothetical protein
MLVERYASVSLATADLPRARWFWVDQELATRDVYAHRGPFSGPEGAYAELRDPDGRRVIFTDAD